MKLLLKIHLLSVFCSSRYSQEFSSSSLNLAASLTPSKEWAPIKYIFGWHGILLELCMVFKSLLSFPEMFQGLIRVLRGAGPWNSNQLFYTQATGKQAGSLHLAEMASSAFSGSLAKLIPKIMGTTGNLRNKEPLPAAMCNCWWLPNPAPAHNC